MFLTRGSVIAADNGLNERQAILVGALLERGSLTLAEASPTSCAARCSATSSGSPRWASSARSGEARPTRSARTGGASPSSDEL